MVLTGVKTMNYLKATDELLSQTKFIRSRIYLAYGEKYWSLIDEPFMQPVKLIYQIL